MILPARKVPVFAKEKVTAPVDQPNEWVSQFVVAVKSLMIYVSALTLNRL